MTTTPSDMTAKKKPESSVEEQGLFKVVSSGQNL